MHTIPFPLSWFLIATVVGLIPAAGTIGYLLIESRRKAGRA